VTTATTPGATSALRRRIVWRWRVVDIVVASVLGVAIGFVFLAWNVGYLAPKTVLEPLLPGLQGLLNGPWLLAGVLGGLVIRKPGAAIYTETIAAVVSALVGNQWGGLPTIEAGLVQGLGAELVLLLFLYSGRVWVAILAGAGAGVAGAINDLVFWYAGSGPAFAAIYLLSSLVSAALLAGLLGWALTRALAATGVLSRFAAGRERRADV
jgi:energy-coupling factor transport system permease protein